VELLVLELSNNSFDLIRDFLEKTTGVVLEEDKQYLVTTRLSSVMRRHGYKDFETLGLELSRSSASNAVVDDVVGALTTHETLFFRDEHPFKALASELLPELAKKGRIKIWCAAASTGQEPYSLAMTIHEEGGAHRFGTVKILATDICKNSIEKAKQGLYTAWEAKRGLSDERRSWHMTERNGSYQMKDNLRSIIDFRILNLIEPFGSEYRDMDLIFLRNVLIYFDDATKISILERMRRCLAPGGYLFLGGAESMGQLGKIFQRVKIGSTWAYQAT
jgi:chemotaxis protein methyltransferase CheR